MKKEVSTESLNILSVYVKTCDKHVEEACSTAARPSGSMDITIDKSGVTRHVCMCVCE